MDIRPTNFVGATIFVVQVSILPPQMAAKIAALQLIIQPQAREIARFSYRISELRHLRHNLQR
jgi:uncharacterized protein YhdP